MNTNERIKSLRKSLGLSQSEFAYKLGINQSTVSDIENGNIAITNRTIEQCVATFHCSRSYLISGEGQMFVDSNLKFNKFFETYNKLQPPAKSFLENIAKELLDLQDKL